MATYNLFKNIENLNTDQMFNDNIQQFINLYKLWDFMENCENPLQEVDRITNKLLDLSL